jgi:hypothetical protein
MKEAVTGKPSGLSPGERPPGEFQHLFTFFEATYTIFRGIFPLG